MGIRLWKTLGQAKQIGEGAVRNDCCWKIKGHFEHDQPFSNFQLWKIHFNIHKCHHCPKFTKHKKTFDSWIESVSQTWQHFLVKWACCGHHHCCTNYCCRLGNKLCLCLPIQSLKAVPKCCPKHMAIDFALKPLIARHHCLMDQPSKVTAIW